MSFRNFIATSYHFNNGKEYLEVAFKELKLDYLVGQVEMCPTTGRTHI